MNRALVTGVTGQDGSYLAELLLEKGYEVHGILRRSSLFNRTRIDHLHKDFESKSVPFFLHYGDLTDSSSLNRIMEKVAPVEIYNLAAQSHVKVSFDVPEYTADVDAIGALRLLEAMRESEIPARFYQASTSELYGKVAEIPQSETTPFNPQSPYAIAKQYAFGITKHYREAYGIHASNGILFNHESPRRGETFVTRKITMGIARIHKGLQDVLFIGNLDALRDWGYAPDYVRAMWMMLQQEHPDDYVIATGEMHSVREFIQEAFMCVGREIYWRGTKVEEEGVDSTTGKVVVKVAPNYFRPLEVDQLLGNSEKARRLLGWMPSVRFSELVRIMVEGDLRLIGTPGYEVGF